MTYNMESLRARLEALLERDLSMNVSSAGLISDSPLLSQSFEFLYTPDGAKESTQKHWGLNSQAEDIQVPQPQGAFSYPVPPGFSEERRQYTNFGYFFADPTPLRLVSDSPLVTPLKFLHY
jgi:hypothetical protein